VIETGVLCLKERERQEGNKKTRKKQQQKSNPSDLQPLRQNQKKTKK
jgi:hypothetical protein